MTTLFGASSSSSSPAPTNSWTYDVFLSFRGEDTRHTFTKHLNKSLVRKGVRTFIDDELRRGEEISAALIKAIEESKLSVIVFSENYASSKWCLEELVKILQCKAWKKQMVYPIFYKVDPSDLRNQTGSFGEALAKHEYEFKNEKDECKFTDKMEKLRRWRNALTEAGNLSGRHLSEDGYEPEFVHEIIEEISTKILKLTPLHVANNPVAIESRVEYILKLLDVEQSNVQMVGIWGIGGIGKTTIAKAVYNSIANEFDGSCFLADVRKESSIQGGLVRLQNHIVSEILGGNPSNKVINRHEGIGVLKQRLSKKKVLLILDDVDHLDQLRELAGRSKWFGSGSRVIITTRDKHCLTAHDVDHIYEVKELDKKDALDLFNSNAFKDESQMKDFVELTNNVILYAEGIPLVLEVLGSHLRGTSMDQWQDAVEYYKTCPDNKIQETLKRSYESLENSMKDIFLHIACFFNGYPKSQVIDILRGCHLNPYGIEVLTEKALIRILEDDKVWMHDLLEDMGKGIVSQDSSKPGERSKLCLFEDVCSVLEENTGTSKVKGIMIPYQKNFPKRICLTGESFKEMKNLQILIVIVREYIIDGGPVDYLSNELTVLHWTYCPLLSFPSKFDPQKLVILNIPGSRMLFLGDELKVMRHLKSLKLQYCEGLTRIPDLSGLTNLEEMDLSFCRNFVEIHNSVGGLGNLVDLRLDCCSKLSMFPTTINLKSLVTLNLSDCLLEFFPEIEREMKSLKYLDLSSTAIKQLPSSFGYLTGLENLDLSRTAIKQLPSSFGYLTSLANLKLDHCENLTYLPCSIFYNLQHLQFVDLLHCPELVTFAAESESLPHLSYSTNSASLAVDLSYCEKLQEISAFPREIDRLIVRDCVSLERISKLSKILEGKESKMMPFMDLSNCQRLCDNLVQDVPKMKKKMPSSSSSSLDNLGELAAATQQLMEVEADEKLKALLSLSLSCRESEFQVVFPASAPVPNWFTCRKDFKGSDINGYEFCIEIPQDFKWVNKGLALCVQTSKLVDEFLVNQVVYINDVCICQNEKDFYDPDLERGNVWVYYIPFITLIKRLGESLSGYMCRITFDLIYGIDSCGVHVLMPKDDEEVSMEVVVHQDKNKRRYWDSNDWEYDEEENQRRYVDSNDWDTEGLDDEEEDCDDRDLEDNEDHQQEPTILGKRKADDISQPIT